MRIKVLIVDDEKDFIEAAAERLRMRNFDVECAGDGQEALDMLSQNEFDVVLLDVLMPGMDGIQTYSKIRELDTTVQVVMLTGHAKIETAIDGIKAGIYDYMLKPVRIEDLVTKVEMAYKQKRLSLQRVFRGKEMVQQKDSL